MIVPGKTEISGVIYVIHITVLEGLTYFLETFLRPESFLDMQSSAQ